MNNEEKAREISKQYFGEPNQVITWQAAMKMAQWKDEQWEQKLQEMYETTIVNDWQYGKDLDHAIIPAIHQRISGYEIGDRVKIFIIKQD